MRFRDIKKGEWYKSTVGGTVSFCKAARSFPATNGRYEWRMVTGPGMSDYMIFCDGTGVSPATEEEVKAFKKDLLKQYKAKIDAL